MAVQEREPAVLDEAPEVRDNGTAPVRTRQFFDSGAAFSFARMSGS
jgi:hypothetical protein